ncbi:hypothetical protein [Lacrimispora amygdalina]|uniref:hypothetical protein n=1 Tax=Lacrimispora amygdalina TaxID=253257 RepID=UPI000BE3199F|nr:hypothetical protein [Lacrimispora amygdalina]
MFKINLSAVKEMNRMERFDAERTFLSLEYEYENEEMLSGSKAMSRSPENILIGNHTYIEHKLLGSYKLLFALSRQIKDRTGINLVEFVKAEDRTAKNALTAWRTIYRKIDALKGTEHTIKKEG